MKKTTKNNLFYIIGALVIVVIILCAYTSYNNSKLQENAVTTENQLPVPPVKGENQDGEADPEKMNLQMNTWVWIKTQSKDGSIITPKQANRFTLRFGNDGKASITTDCNGMGANFSDARPRLIFTDIVMTQMLCEGSQELIFSKSLDGIGSYSFTGRGELILKNNVTGETMTFR